MYVVWGGVWGLPLCSSEGPQGLSGPHGDPGPQVMYIHTNARTRIHKCMHLCIIHDRMETTHAHAHSHARAQHTYVCIHVCIHVYVCMYVYIHVYLSLCVCLYTQYTH